MTPQERDLVAQLFDRLAALESNPRDTDAERTIAEGLRRAPHAVYALVQTVLVQDEALKAANSRIEELEEALGPAPEPGRQQGGFLDNMRGALFGRREEPPRGGAPPGSVPSVRPGGDPWGAGAYRGEPPGPMPGAPPSRGGFLGTAAAAAAGMVGGGLLLGGIRSMLGGQQHSPAAGALDQLAAGPTPSGGQGPGGQGSGDLARQAGLDDVGRGGHGAGGRPAGLSDPKKDEKPDDDDDNGDDDNGDDDNGDDDNGDDDDDT